MKNHYYTKAADIVVQLKVNARCAKTETERADLKAKALTVTGAFVTYFGERPSFDAMRFREYIERETEREWEELKGQAWARHEGEGVEPRPAKERTNPLGKPPGTCARCGGSLESTYVRINGDPKASYLDINCFKKLRQTNHSKKEKPYGALFEYNEESGQYHRRPELEVELNTYEGEGK